MKKPFPRKIHIGPQEWSYRIADQWLWIRSPDLQTTTKVSFKSLTSLDSTEEITIRPQDIRDFINNAFQPVTYPEGAGVHFRREIGGPHLRLDKVRDSSDDEIVGDWQKAVYLDGAEYDVFVGSTSEGADPKPRANLDFSVLLAAMRELKLRRLLWDGGIRLVAYDGLNNFEVDDSDIKSPVQSFLNEVAAMIDQNNIDAFEVVVPHE